MTPCGQYGTVNNMNRLELVECLAAKYGHKIAKTDIDRLLISCFEQIIDACAEGRTVTLIGFGTFEAVESAARTGRNPSTGQLIHIPAQRKPKFIPGTRFKETLNRKDEE